MCGIIGAMSLSNNGLSRDECKALWAMTVADTVRGDDGTGMFMVDLKGEPFYYKAVEVGPKFMTKNDWYDMAGGNKLAIAHNRAATLGTISEEDTHPFFYGDIIGVHNGTIPTWQDFATTATMDSQAVFESLSLADPDDESISTLLKQFDLGAYSLVWYDRRTRELKLARNSDRPMSMGITRRAIMLSSELGIMQWAAHRAKETLQLSWSNEVDTLVSIPIDEGGKARTHEYTPPVTSCWPSRNGISSTGYYYKSHAGSPSDWDDAWDSWEDPYATLQEAQANALNQIKDKPNTISGNKKVVTFDEHLSIRLEELYGYPTMLARSSYSPWSPAFVSGVDSGALEVAFSKMKGTLGGERVSDGAQLHNTHDGFISKRPFITGIVNDLAYGFVNVQEYRYPVVMETSKLSTGLLNDVRAVTANGGIAELPSYLIGGVVLYSSGHRGYIIGARANTTPPESLVKHWPGTTRRSELDLFSVLNHPHRQASRLDKAASWKQGWEIQAQIDIDRMYKGG